MTKILVEARFAEELELSSEESIILYNIAIGEDATVNFSLTPSKEGSFVILFSYETPPTGKLSYLAHYLTVYDY